MLFWASRLFNGFEWSREVRIELEEDGRIRSLSPGSPPPRDSQRVGLVLPSLVNAHVHLELGPLPLRAPPQDFLTWIGAVLGSRATASREQIRAQAEAGLRALRASGTGTLSEVDSMGLGMEALAKAGREQPFEVRCDAEVLGFSLEADQARALCEERLASIPEGLGAGLSPHAPYSVSSALFREAASMAVPLSIHVSETPEEVEFCRKGTGPFRDLLISLGKLPQAFGAPGCSPLAHLHELGLLGPRTLLVHMQEICPGDLEILEETGSPVVLCPGTISYFGRSAPAYEAFRERGILCALGTDSMASNEELDMFRELAGFRRMFPGVGEAELLRLGTSAGGQALGIPGAGCLREGDSFDALVFSDFPQSSVAETTDILLSRRIPPFILYARGRSVL